MNSTTGARSAVSSRCPDERLDGHATRRAQRGVALITAVLIVALATILAVNVVYRGMLDQRRAGTLFALDQAFEVALGAEAWAADVLQRDAAGVSG